MLEEVTFSRGLLPISSFKEAARDDLISKMEASFEFRLYELVTNHQPLPSLLPLNFREMRDPGKQLIQFFQQTQPILPHFPVFGHHQNLVKKPIHGGA